MHASSPPQDAACPRPPSPSCSSQSADTQESTGGGGWARGRAAAPKRGGAGASGAPGRLRSALSVDSSIDEILASNSDQLPAAPADCFSDLDRELQRLIQIDWMGAEGEGAADLGSSTAATGPSRRGPGGGAAARAGAAAPLLKGAPKAQPGVAGQGQRGLPSDAAAAGAPAGAAAAAAGAGAGAPVRIAPKIIVKLPKGIAARGGRSSGAGASSGSGGAGGAALGPANAGVQKRLTLKGLSRSNSGKVAAS